jgi:glycosyltransferase involved in cell wall biosynthesis
MPNVFPLNHIFFNILAFIKSLKIKHDIVHICSPFGILNMIFKRKPTVVKIHTLYKKQTGNFLYTHFIFPLTSFIDNYLMRKADGVITITNFMKKDIINYAKIESDKIKVIYNGVSQEFFIKKESKKSLRKKLSISQDKNIIL